MNRRGFLKIGALTAGAASIPPSISKLFEGQGNSVKVIPFSNAAAENYTPTPHIDYRKFKTQQEVNKITQRGDYGLGRDGNTYCYIGNNEWLPIDSRVKSIFSTS